MPKFRHLNRLKELRFPSLEVMVTWFLPIGGLLAVTMICLLIVSYTGQFVPQVTAKVQATEATAPMAVTVVEEEPAAFTPVVLTMPSVSADAFLPKPVVIEHTVTGGENLVKILRRYCRDDYEVVARENDIKDPNVIHPTQVIRFTNGCSNNTPSVLVNRNVFPRESASDGGASSGKRIPTLVTRAPEAKTLPPVVLAASAPAPSASQSIQAAAPAPLAASVPYAEPPVTVAKLRPAKAQPVTLPATSVAKAVPIGKNGKPILSKVYHREIYRVAALRKEQIAGSLSKAGYAEMSRLQSKIRVAVLEQFPLKNADCLYDTKLTQIDRLHCIRENYGAVIAEQVKRYPNLPLLTQSLVEAVTLVESGGRPDAISETGCTGVKQFTMGSADKFGLEDRLDPYESVRAGVDHLAANLILWGGSVAKATAHYNIGSVVVAQKGFDAKNFPYTRAVLGAQNVIDRHLPATSVATRVVDTTATPALQQLISSQPVRSLPEGKRYVRLAPGQAPLLVTVVR